MAKFVSAFSRTMQFEGGYSNDPLDKGGETFRGISRRFNPSWLGWKVVDQKKKDVKALLKDTKLDQLVSEFYKTNYWDVFEADNISDQKVAEELFDTGVNLGIQRAGTFLQQSLNALNRNGTLFPDLVVDGRHGPKSASALGRILGSGDGEIVWKILSVLKGNHYLEYMKQSPEQEAYARGWFKRVFAS